MSQPKPPKPPKPPELQKVVPPPPPMPPVAAPKQLQTQGAKPDLRIGANKVSSAGSRKRVDSGSLRSSLNMGGGNGGLNL